VVIIENGSDFKDGSSSSSSRSVPPIFPVSKFSEATRLDCLSAFVPCIRKDTELPKSTRRRESYEHFLNSIVQEVPNDAQR